MNQYDDLNFFNEYAKMTRSQHGLPGAGEWHQLKKLFPEMQGKAVLDLGCGYGWHCKYAIEQGATAVLGIDASERMIKAACEKNEGTGIAYRVCRLEEYDYPREAYDLVISNLVLHYIQDLDAIYRNIFCTLKPGGKFLFNIEHPTFTAGVHQQFSENGYWPVDNYYYPGERETEFLGCTVIKQHHTLTQILMGLIHAGFILEVVEEVLPPEEWRADMPEEMRRPMMLLIRAKKPSL